MLFNELVEKAVYLFPEGPPHYGDVWAQVEGSTAKMYGDFPLSLLNREAAPNLLVFPLFLFKFLITLRKEDFWELKLRIRAISQLRLKLLPSDYTCACPLLCRRYSADRTCGNLASRQLYALHFSAINWAYYLFPRIIGRVVLPFLYLKY